MIGTLGNLDHGSVGLIIDDPLAKAIGKVVDETDIIMQNMEKDSLLLLGKRKAMDLRIPSKLLMKS